MIRVYDHFSVELETVWRSLEPVACGTVFQTLAWCRNAWEALLAYGRGNRLHVIVWHGKPDEAAVLMPTYLDAWGALRFINDGHSDFGDALYVPGVNKHYAFEAIAEVIRSDAKVKSAVLQKFRQNSEALGYLGAFMKDALVYRDHTFSHVEIVQAADFALGQPHLRKRERKRLAVAAFEVSGAVLETCSAQVGVPFPEARILALRDHMRKQKWRDRDFLDDNLVGFVRRIYSAGICELVFIVLAGCDMAVSLQLRSGTGLFCWIMLYREPRWNTLLHVKYFDSVAKTISCRVDLGVGTYVYKLETFRPRLGCTFSLRLDKSVFRRIVGFLFMNWRFIRQGVHR